MYLETYTKEAQNPIAETAPGESSQIEDRGQIDRQSESQTEDKMDTPIPQLPTRDDDSSDEDEGRPTRKVIIDEDEEITPEKQGSTVTIAEVPKGLPYEDHNYGFGRPATRVISDENNEPFPVIGGLASYLGEEENHLPPPQQVSRPITR